jgi:hypothetical protein
MQTDKSYELSNCFEIYPFATGLVLSSVIFTSCGESEAKSEHKEKRLQLQRFPP